jgi:hypothetical protein
MVSVHLLKGAESDVFAIPLTSHIALVGPFHAQDTSCERCEDGGLPPRCLCVYLRRLNMHDADQDIPALTNRLQQSTPIASRFSSATACTVVAKNEPVKLYLLRFESLAS